MTEIFDAVIIGSGFGGSVMAYRLAEAGMRVCLLERGKAYPPKWRDGDAGYAAIVCAAEWTGKVFNKSYGK